MSRKRSASAAFCSVVRTRSIARAGSGAPSRNERRQGPWKYPIYRSTLSSTAVVAIAVALPVAFLVSLALLWVYLRAVKRSMLRRAVGEPRRSRRLPRTTLQGKPSARRKSHSDIVTVDAGAIPGRWNVTRRIWFAGMIYAIAGLAFAYVVATAFLLRGGVGFDWQAVLFLAMLFTGPIVITLGLVCSVSWLGLGLLVLGYALVLAATIAVLAAGTTITVGQVATLWFTTNTLGCLMVARPSRTTNSGRGTDGCGAHHRCRCGRDLHPLRRLQQRYRPWYSFRQSTPGSTSVCTSPSHWFCSSAPSRWG